MICGLILLTGLLVGSVSADTDAPCYLPDGVQATGFFACDPTAYITSCCPEGWTCYSNSMCVVTDPHAANSSRPLGSSIRGSCTNPEWNNAVCGDFCLTDRDINGDLEACGDDKFCCADDPDCSCEEGAFRLNPGRAQTIIGVQGLEQTQTSAISSSMSSASAIPSSTLTTTSRTPSSTSIGDQTPTPTALPSEKKPLDKPEVKAGVALGVVIGVIGIAVAAWLVWRYCFSASHRMRRNQPAVQPSSTPAGPAENQDPYVRGNAANLAVDPPVSAVTRHSRQSEDFFDRGDAPMGNAYERDTPSRNTFVHFSPTRGSGVLNDGYTGMRDSAGRRLSWVSDEESQYVRPRASELGL